MRARWVYPPVSSLANSIPYCRTMKLKVAWWWCVSLLLLAAAVSAQEEEEEEEEGATEGPGKTSSGPRKPVFKEPSYPSGDVYLVETFTDSAEVWERSVVPTGTQVKVKAL